MNRDVKIALCTLALMTGGFAIQSTESAHAAQATEAATIAAPENGIVTKAYVKSIKDAGVSIQSVINQYANQIVEIDSHAFEFCDEELDLSKAINLKIINNDAFFKTNLKAINLSNVESIGNYAFAGCTMLKNIELGNINKISTGAFMGCAGLENIVLPESVTAIENGAFAGTGLKSIRLPANVKDVDANAFGGCQNMVYAVIENPNINVSYTTFSKSYIPEAVRHYGLKGSEYFWFVLGAPKIRSSLDLLSVSPYGLNWLPVTVFCDNPSIGLPLAEMEGFKLITSEWYQGPIVTIDLNGELEHVSGFVKNDKGELLANSEGTLVLTHRGVTHIGNICRLSDNVKTVVIPEGIVRICGDLPIHHGSKIDYVISNSVQFDDKVSYGGIGGTIYTNNQTVIDTMTKNLDDDMIKPLTATHHLMLSDDAEIHALWAELAQLRARDSGHLALDEASALFDDSAFLNSSRAAHDKLAANMELKNKLREEIEKLQNAE